MKGKTPTEMVPGWHGPRGVQDHIKGTRLSLLEIGYWDLGRPPLVLPSPDRPPRGLQVEQDLVGSVLDRLADKLDNHRAVAWALAVEGPHLMLHLCMVAHAARAGGR